MYLKMYNVGEKEIFFSFLELYLLFKFFLYVCTFVDLQGIIRSKSFSFAMDFLGNGSLAILLVLVRDLVPRNSVTMSWERTILRGNCKGSIPL